VLPALKKDDPVWARPKNDEAVVVQPQCQSPGSVLVKTDQGIQRRNRRHLRRRRPGATPVRATHPQVISTLPEQSPVIDGGSFEEPEVGPDHPPVTAATKEAATPGRPPDVQCARQQDPQCTYTKSGRRVNPPQKLDL
jgi:hypothetical protein